MRLHVLRPGLAALSLCASLCAGVLCGVAGAVNIRVLIASGASVDLKIPLSTASAYSAGLGSAAWTVTAGGAHLNLNGQDSGSARLYLPPAPGSSVSVDGVTYRGGVYLSLSGRQVRAINVVDIEDYLRSVVPAEMPPSWPAEALRAQAVIARTYAVARLSPQADYDLCATEQCQVYPGVSREAASTDAAVAATAATVVSWQNQPAKTYFSSDSGGYTASSAEVWNTPLPYLVAKPDPASRGPRSSWTLSVPLARMAQLASRYGVHVGALQSVQISQLTASGRLQQLTFVGSAGSDTLGGAEAGGFVHALGGYSTRVSLSGTDPVTLTGEGNGHGVGLSQYGASGLAAQGWNYLQVLGFYYPSASISALQDAGVRQAPRLVGSTPLNLAGARLAAGLNALPTAAPTGAPPLTALFEPLLKSFRAL